MRSSRRVPLEKKRRRRVLGYLGFRRVSLEGGDSRGRPWMERDTFKGEETKNLLLQHPRVATVASTTPPRGSIAVGGIVDSGGPCGEQDGQGSRIPSWSGQGCGTQAAVPEALQLIAASMCPPCRVTSHGARAMRPSLHGGNLVHSKKAQVDTGMD